MFSCFRVFPNKEVPYITAAVALVCENAWESDIRQRALCFALFRWDWEPHRACFYNCAMFVWVDCERKTHTVGDVRDVVLSGSQACAVHAGPLCSSSLWSLCFIFFFFRRALLSSSTYSAVDTLFTPSSLLFMTHVCRYGEMLFPLLHKVIWNEGDAQGLNSVAWNEALQCLPCCGKPPSLESHHLSELLPPATSFLHCLWCYCT